VGEASIVHHSRCEAFGDRKCQLDPGCAGFGIGPI
jgi:hypothetical protein